MGISIDLVLIILKIPIILIAIYKFRIVEIVQFANNINNHNRIKLITLVTSFCK